ncbi:MAG TPA: hypothetical protein VE775_09405 [Pyrinomonadaceae bacterium]|nr:hypothetical protein [Pyrinomonadaceae bacterium]
MFCPQCSQQQASAAQRFCSRCGFPLSVVAELLANGGMLAAHTEADAARPAISSRGRGLRQGFAILFIGWVITAVIAVLTSTAHAHPETFIPMAGILFNGLGLGRIIYALLFQESTPKRKRSEPLAYAPPAPTNELAGAGSAGAALPPAQSIPVPNLQRPRVADVAHPPSVTENTTKLLDH